MISSLSKMMRSAQVRTIVYFVIVPVTTYYEVIYWIKNKFK